MESHRLRIEQLTEAVERRTTIGMAMGILMERFGFDNDRAFDFLRRCSQAQNRKLFDICAELVTNRELPELAPRPQSA